MSNTHLSANITSLMPKYGRSCYWLQEYDNGSKTASVAIGIMKGRSASGAIARFARSFPM
jgi:hypothetical protein